MIPTISLDTLRAGHCGAVVDVRSAAEFATGHIPCAMNVPMEEIERRRADLGDGPLVLVCEAGVRASVVAGWLDTQHAVSVLEGGTAAWRKAGLPLVKCGSCRWSLERQVRFTAGLIVLLASALAVLASPLWMYLTMIVGAGLTFAGATNICGMATLLAHMPWNRTPDASRSVLTKVSSVRTS